MGRSAQMVRRGGMKVEVRGTSPYWLSRNDGVESMAMPQRDDPPTPSSFAEATEDKWLRRTGTIEAIKRRAAEKKAAEEKKKAEARARAAYRRKQRQGARCRLQRFPPTSRNRRRRNGRKSCARSSAASRGCDRMWCRCECGIISTEKKT